MMSGKYLLRLKGVLRFVFPLLVCFGGWFSAHSQTISTAAVSSNSFCAGSTVNVSYTVTGVFNTDNTFAVQLSSSTGSFSSPTIIGTLSATAAGTIAATMPLTLAVGNQYRVRVVSSSPVVSGTDNGSNLTIATLSLSAPSISGFPFCAGSTFNITNSLANACSFGTGNMFAVQLSSSTGSFASPTTIGTLSSTTGGTISVTIPLSTVAGAGYLIQVVSSNPALTSPASGAFSVTSLGLGAPAVTGSSFCAGNTFNITNNLTSACSFGTGNTFMVQLSNSSGNFATPTTIGSISSTSGGSISVNVPFTTTTGTGYKIQVVSSNPVITSAASAAFTVNGLGINAPTVATPICQGATFNITNNLPNVCAFGSGNTFVVQLSDPLGSFVTPTSIGSGTTSGAISVTIPQTQTIGTGYLARVVSSNPVIISPITVALTINSPGLNAPSGVATRCAGTTFSLVNNSGSCSFFSGNMFTAQLSDASGSFASPTTIGMSNSTTGGNITVTLPLTATTSSNYRIQVVSSNPATTSPASPAFTINGFGIAAPTISGGATAYCQGQNITVNYTVTAGCTFPNSPSSNVFTAQLSDAYGGFSSPTSIGSITSNGSGAISANLGNPVGGTGYRIRVVSSNPGTGAIGPDNGTDLTIGASSGNPTTFGNGVWNAYVYNSNTIGGFTNYTGNYTVSGLSFNTATQYGISSSPTTATGYVGCSTTGATNYGISFKQTNFPCGYYQLSIPYQNDQSAVYVNGSLVFQNAIATSTVQNNVWSGFLNATSTVEIRFVNLTGTGQLQIALAAVAVPVTISPTSLVQCSAPTNPGVLVASSSVPLSYAWTPTTGLTPSNGLSASVTASPAATTTYTVTGTDVTTSCTVTGTVTVSVSNAKPTIVASASTPAICSGIANTTLSASGGVNYSWTPDTSLAPSSGIGATVTANPASTTTYTVTGDNGCTGSANSNTANVAVIVQNIPSLPATTTFGNNTWNVYCNYNNTTFSNYYGYYTENNLSFSTTNRWGNSSGPSVANASSGNAYTGCSFVTGTSSCGANTLNYTNYSMSFKRTNFTCGYYQIDVNYQDDQFTLLVNGVQVFQNNGYTPTLQSNVWTGFLGPTSQVELRLTNFCGPGQLQVTFGASTNSPLVVSSPSTVCAGTTTPLSASSLLTGATFSWTNGLPVNNGTITSPNNANTFASPFVSDTYACTLTDAGNTGCSSSLGTAITVNPIATTTLSINPAITTTYCAGGTYTFTASGASSYIWSSIPTDPTLSSTSGFQVTANPAVTTTYTVSGSTNCPPAINASQSITVAPLPSFATFPSNSWNAYGFNSTTVGTNYEGYYTNNGSGVTGYDFNTSTQWVSGAAPSTATATNGTAWLGCPMNPTNMSLSFKRTGFVCGLYQLNIIFQDDASALLVNGVKVFQNNYYTPTVQTNVWTGILTTTSTVEWQLVQGGGGSGLSVQFVPIGQVAGTNLWTGVVSTDWFNPSNWCGTVPTSTTDAIIGQGSVNMPTIGNSGAQVRTITINQSASLTTLATNNLNVYGNWTNDGTYTPNLGTITFTGSGGGTINSAGTTTFNNLVINNSGGVIIASGTHRVSGSMTFNSGIVTQNSTLNILNGASVVGASNASYLDGMITKTGNSAFTFPVGNGGYYGPISMSAPSLTTDNFTARYIHTSANSSYPLTQIVPTLDHVSAAEYWVLDRLSGISNVSVTLSWNSPQSGSIGNISALHVARWDATSSEWVDQGAAGTIGNTTSGSVSSASTISSFSTPNSPFTLGTITNQNALPIQLVNFGCSISSNGTVKLIWTTESEINNDHFEIDRSGDGTSFIAVGMVKGAGTSSLEHYYSFVDELPLRGKSYYRLMQTDFDGIQSSSDICLVDDNSAPSEVTVYPNPASTSVTVIYSNIGAVSGMKLFNSIGQEVTIFPEISDSTIRLNTSQQANGVYIIALVTTSGIRTAKLIIAK